jgi:hypothetical protein
VSLRALCVVALALICAACAAQPAGPPTTRQEQKVDGLTIGLETPQQPKLNTAQELVITLTDAQGQPVDGASVYVDLLMVSMPMGTNRPVAAGEGKGRYRVQTAFTMSGEWDLTVVAEIGGVEHRAVFKTEVPK